jgi:cytidine deaminase
LSDQTDQLIEAAKSACENAYAPYSGFPVGAAVLDDQGRVFAACNVENASYGLSICAERNAVFQAVAHGAREIRAVALYTPTPAPATPCGACRQVLNEFGPGAEVYCMCDGESYFTTVDSLLPAAFGLPARDRED